MSVYSVIMWNVLELREFARGESNRSLDVFLTKPNGQFWIFSQNCPTMKAKSRQSRLRGWAVASVAVLVHQRWATM